MEIFRVSLAESQDCSLENMRHNRLGKKGKSYEAALRHTGWKVAPFSSTAAKKKNKNKNNTLLKANAVAPPHRSFNLYTSF